MTNSGNLDGTELYFYTGNQVIEVRDGSENMVRQVVHGLRYIDEAVLEILGDGVVWVHQADRDQGGSVKDWNVLALTDFAGRTLERYDQTPYGIITVDQDSYWGDSDADGLVTEAEWDTDTDGSLDSDDDCWGSDPSGTCRLVDFDFDNDVDATDSTRLAQLDSSTTYRTPGQSRSQLGNTRAHQGLIFDPEIGSYNNRARQYTPQLKRFMQRDPLLRGRRGGGGYQDGLNAYTYAGFSPTGRRDPSGRFVDFDTIVTVIEMIDYFNILATLQATCCCGFDHDWPTFVCQSSDEHDFNYYDSGYERCGEECSVKSYCQHGWMCWEEAMEVTGWQRRSTGICQDYECLQVTFVVGTGEDPDFGSDDDYPGLRRWSCPSSGVFWTMVNYGGDEDEPIDPSDSCGAYES